MLIKIDVLKVSGTLVLLFLLCKSTDAQKITDHSPVRLMFYNVENLFDVNDDSLTNDDDFTPGGVMRWNRTRYRGKINSVYKTITATGEWEPPAIVAFCEIENRKVLDDLLNMTYLSNFNYGIVHENSPDERGIDVCFIFREDLIHIISYKSLIPLSFLKTGFHTRSVLYAKCAILNDTIHLMINHWPSRRGGVMATEDSRLTISQMVRNVCDSLHKCSNGTAKIIIMGDFNCKPDDPAIQLLTKENFNIDVQNSLKLLNLARAGKTGIPGTYNYLGAWEIIDQIIVSEQLLNSEKGLAAALDGYRIFSPEFLLKDDTKYPGKTTFSTYKGYRYQGGFSDHLPVLLDLTFR